MSELEKLAALIRERNLLEERIFEIIGRPASIGHLGEYIAREVFDIRLAESANYKSIDGWFQSGRLQGKSVNVKWYAKHEGLLDMCLDTGPDYYLVLAGPSQPASRANRPRPWLIESVHLLEHELLRKVLTSKIGIATSIRREVWKRHQIFPLHNPELLGLSEEQVQALSLFGSSRA